MVEVITELEDREQFHLLLKKNPGLIIVKLGAEWCKPCKIIKDDVHQFFMQTPPNVICCDLDVDTSDDVYAYLKAKRMVKGIPTLLCYKKGNESFAPDDLISGADKDQLEVFFRRCGFHLKDTNRNK